MTEPPDYQDLSARYMKLWQEHLSNASTDPAMAEAMMRMMQSWQTMFGAMAGPGGMAGMGTPQQGNGGDGNDSAPDRTATASASSGRADDALREFDRRLALLEERVDAIQSGLDRLRDGS